MHTEDFTIFRIFSGTYPLESSPLGVYKPLLGISQYYKFNYLILGKCYLCIIIS